MRSPKLTDAELKHALEALPGWALADGKLLRVYKFRDFIEAFAFMTAAALRVQEMDHHPEWSNVYGTVRVELVTHDSGGVTARDAELAGKFEALAARWPKP